MSQVYAIANQKGGVGKSLFSGSLPGALAGRVLLVDTDPPGHTTKWMRWTAAGEIAKREELGLPIPRALYQTAEQDDEELAKAQEEASAAWRERQERGEISEEWQEKIARGEAKPGTPEPEPAVTLESVATPLYEWEEGPNLFMALIPEADQPNRRRKRQEIRASDLIRKLPGESFDILPAHMDMTSLEQWLSNVPQGLGRFSDLMEELETEYDHIVIDSPPNLGPITDSVLYYARSTDKHRTVSPGRAGIIVPLEADDESLNALEQLFDQIGTLEERAKIKIDILSVVINKYEDSNQLSKDVAKEIRAAIPAEVAAPFEVRKRNIVRNAYRAQQSIYTFSPKERHRQKEIQDLRGWFALLAEHAQGRLKQLKG